MSQADFAAQCLVHQLADGEYALERASVEEIDLLRACLERGWLANPSTWQENLLGVMEQRGLVSRLVWETRHQHHRIYTCTPLGGDVAILAARQRQAGRAEPAYGGDPLRPRRDRAKGKGV